MHLFQFDVFFFKIFMENLQTFDGTVLHHDNALFFKQHGFSLGLQGLVLTLFILIQRSQQVHVMFDLHLFQLFADYF